jgi:DNA helicase HerA-like ATPase
LEAAIVTTRLADLVVDLVADRDPREPVPTDEAVGTVLAVRGAAVEVDLGTARARHTVGDHLAIITAAGLVVGVIGEVRAEPGLHAVGRLELVGEIEAGRGGASRFRRGVRGYPAIGDVVRPVTTETLRVIYSRHGGHPMPLGPLAQDAGGDAGADADSLLAKHFAVLGSTGVGKSCGVAVIVNALLDVNPALRVFILDAHNEYGQAFGGRACVTGAEDLRLPFWLFNFEELTDVVYGGRPAVPEEVDVLAELIPLARSQYHTLKAGSDRPGLVRRQTRAAGFTVDTPTPYLLQDLVTLIDDRMGKLENRSSRMHYQRLLTRIETIRNDPRYGFMFENANVGGDTMATVLARLFRLEGDDRPATVLRLASLPGEAVDAVVCVTLRLAFEFGLWSDGALPLLVVCEEAHRYAARNHAVGFAPARRSLARIAKEGRKYAVHLGLVSQRPAELDATIISQCSTLFALRMTNDEDQALLRSAVSDAAVRLLELVPSLGTGEVIGLGEGMPVPTRFAFHTLPPDRVPRSDVAAGHDRLAALEAAQFVRQVVERWRRATVTPVALADDEAPTSPPPTAAERLEQTAGLMRQALAGSELPAAAASAASLVERTRAALLRR